MPSDDGRLCGGCQRKPFPFPKAFAAYAYGGSLSQAIVRFKHGGSRHLARPLGRCLRPVIEKAVRRTGSDVVCPVPLHPRRLRQRGYNQVLELLRLAKPWLAGNGAELLPDAMARIVDTPSLGHHSPDRRRNLVARAFAVVRPNKIVGKHALLVDDVMTTGATLAEGARTLLSAGARSVTVAVLARAL
jgi:ComF family protein